MKKGTGSAVLLAIIWLVYLSGHMKRQPAHPTWMTWLSFLLMDATFCAIHVNVEGWGVSTCLIHWISSNQ
ncbi:hypothetical protein [Paenibacillus sp. MER TA 81-3]|uniref:hypothetical protein n=1 Tax=Paenibacillus sp. MER TA 81-3 TaxID=2939573 RepID=UPI00203E2C9C|nr:hypothetical protein [Paenibacillus sp. MER TA 81-3]